MGEARSRAERNRTITIVSASNPQLAEHLLATDPWAPSKPKATSPGPEEIEMLKKLFPGKRR